MINIKSPREINTMKEAGRIAAKVLTLLERMSVEGVSTLEMDKAARKFIESANARPSFLNYDGFPNSVCISLNEQVVHGIPDGRKLKSGDIVSCDVGVCLDGWHADAARTFFVGDVSREANKLAEVTRECFFMAMKFARQGFRVSDISRAVQAHAESHGYGVVRDLTGHGIGRNLHEKPEVPNFYEPRHGKGVRLVSGMAIAVEPMINMGTHEVRVLPNGWTVITGDGSLSAHYENTVVITDGEPIITTLLEE